MLSYQTKLRLMEHYHISWLELPLLTTADISQAQANWVAQSESQDD